MVHNLTLEDLRRSKSLRTLILDYDLTLFRRDPAPKGSFERTYTSKREEEVAAVQSTKQTSLYEVSNER